MRDKLIKLLGGFLLSELVRREDTWKASYDAHLAHINFLEGQLKEKDQEIARLTNLMLSKAGFIVPEVKTEETKHEPINSRKPWKSRQRELELADALKAADEVERRWKTKPGAMLEGTEPHDGQGGKTELAG